MNIERPSRATLYVLIPSTVVLALFALFVWPTLYRYEKIGPSSAEKIYKINRLTGYATQIAPPLPKEVEWGKNDPPATPEQIRATVKRMNPGATPGKIEEHVQYLLEKYRKGEKMMDLRDCPTVEEYMESQRKAQAAQQRRT